ncbi:MAG: lipopolysaccharide heptosyltransferase II [Geobacter sp.]|nr:lipopolysaccharide heptosyltransferase II [Geobacter sp.]
MTDHDITNPRRILIRSVNWVGDAVMTTPAIGLIRQHYPQSEITVLANKMVGEIFSRHEWVDRVITFDRQGKHKGISGRFRLAQELRKKSFDMAIILPNSFDSALVPWLAGIPVRLGKNSDGRGLMLTGRYTPSNSAVITHEVGYYIDLVRHFGISGRTDDPTLFIAPDENAKAAERLALHGISDGEMLVGINPGAAFGSAKRWYPERFAEVALRLAEEWSARIVIFGGPSETDIAADIEKRLDGDALNLAGKTSVRELMALIGRCNFFVTNDSGPMHIAAALGVPLAAIFGSTDHATTSPYTEKAVIIRKAIHCAPCKLRECPTDHECMTAVTADDVVAESIKLMASLTGKIQLNGTEKSKP